jgi:hypothetical protein
VITRLQQVSTTSMTTAPKYRPLLRPIGAYLDSLNVQSLLLAESEQGFIWRCFARENPAQLLYGVIGHDEIPQITESIKASRLGRVPDLVIDEPVDERDRHWLSGRSSHARLSTESERRIDAACPFGYEELFRCLSYKLDREAATSFVLQEDDKSILIQFTLNVPIYVQMEPDRFVSSNYFHEDYLDRDDIIGLVRHVRGFRGTKFYR